MMTGFAEVDVVVIGAGAAGLAAAGEIEKGGLRVLCLEARDRIGGRILTLRDASIPVPVELGAEFVHGSAPEILELAREFNLLVEDVTFEGQTYRDAEWRGGGENSEMWDLMELTLQHEGPDVSWAEFLTSVDASDDAKREATRYVEGFNAARAGIISVASIAQDLKAAQELGERHQFRILTGYDWIPLALSRSLREPGNAIRLRSPIDRVDWRPGVVSVGIAGTEEPIQARAAVVTVPVGLLQAEGIRFSPAPEEWLRAASEIAVGHVFRMVLHFRERFWNRVESLKDAGFLFSDEEIFPTWWTTLPARTSVITGWSAGPHAELLIGKTPEDVLEGALASLAKLTGQNLDFLKRKLQTWHVHDWEADPYSRGAYSYSRAGHLDARARLAKPVENTLFFSGEATETEGHSGTVHGAIASGRRAARDVLQALG